MEPEGSVDKIMYALRERAKELHCLYDVHEIMNRVDASVQDVCQALLTIIPPGWQFPHMCFARITLDGVIYEPPLAACTEWVQKADVVVHGRVRWLHRGLLHRASPRLPARDRFSSKSAS